MNDKLANLYRESQRELFAENEQLQAENERLQSSADELIKILDWFSEHLPNEYHGFHGDRNLQGETASEMVITTITDLRAELERRRPAIVVTDEEIRNASARGELTGAGISWD